MNQELACDLLKKILKRTNEIGEEVQQIKEDLIRLETLLKPPQTEHVFNQKPEISSFQSKLNKVSIKDLFDNDDENKSSLLDLTNATLNTTSASPNNVVKKNESKSSMYASNKTSHKFKDIKQSPLKSVFPQYFYNKTPVKSPSMISKYNEQAENNENKSDKLLLKTKQISNLRSNDLLNEIPSPKKTNLSTIQPKLKQLTMTQALSTQLNSPKKLNSSNNLPTTTNVVSIKQENSDKSNDKPTSTINSFFKNTSNLAKPSTQAQDPNETCLPTVFNVKNEPVDLDMTSIDTTNQISFNNMQIKTENSQFDKDYFADFDKVPKKKSDSPTYKHVQVVRKQDERKKLGTSACRECENYWNSLPEDKRPLRMDELCRHRAKYQAPSTPEHYWDIAFPTREECIERGYGGVITQKDNDDSLMARRPRRKRPLRLIEKEKNNDDIFSDLELDFENC